MKCFDQRTRADHPYLVAADQCWWLAEYICGHARRAGSVSQIIVSLKQPASQAAFQTRRARGRRYAVQTLAALLRASVARDWAEEATWIPIPSARLSCDSDHGRLLPVLRLAFRNYDVDIRPILSVRDSTEPDHVLARRSSPGELYGRLRVNWPLIAARPLRERLVLFDDVVTTGKHYRCCERVLHRALPRTCVTGLFLSRRVLSGRACRPP